VRVAIFSPVWFPVPPTRYGGVEAIVQLLADGLVDAGADVTLFASGDSATRADLVAAFDVAPSEHIGETFWELQHAVELLARVDEYDVVHDHSGLLGLALFGLTGRPLVHTVHGPLTGQPGEVYERTCAAVPNASLVSLTMNQRLPLPHLRWLANVPNAVELERYPFERTPGDNLLFLGRMSPDKGAHRAIRVARRTGRPLVLAAKCREPGEIEYFEKFVEPHLSDEIVYVGEVGHDEKCRLLTEAHALLVPIEWEEPFGLVMIEAMACGTPAIALRRGSVPEVLTDGRTGFIADDLATMVARVERVHELDPVTMRAEAARRFSVERMVDGYIDAYERAMDAAPAVGALSPSVLPLLDDTADLDDLDELDEVDAAPAA
jgi:glycosyltransferase involved in cell wall biosynthesis